MKPEEIRQRFNKLVSARTTVQDTWDSVERYIAPYRGKFFRDENNENSIEWRRPFVYDATAVMGSQALAAHLHSSLTSPSIRWFDLRFREEVLNKDSEAVKWLEESTNTMFKTLQDSNFNLQIGETYQDLVDFGTSIIMEEPENEKDWEGINFQSIPVKECFFEQDHKGGVLNFYRRFEWTANQIVEKFGDEAPKDFREKAADDSANAEEKEILIYCIYKRRNVDKEVDLTIPVAPKARPWGSRYIILKDAKQIGKEGGFYEMPCFVPRWRTTSSSMWGNSPAMLALSDTMTLNHMIELMIQAAEKVIDPPVLATERGLISDLDLNPGGLTIVKDLSQLAPFESGANFNINYSEIERYRNNIREYFLIDQLMLPKMEGTPATATEINARVAQLERLIGPTLGRLQKDLLGPTISRTFNILFRAKQFSEMPDSVRQNATDLDIEYVGPLARTQQAHQVDSFERWVMQLQGIAQTNPEVLDIPDWDLAAREIGYLDGVPAKFMKGEKQVKQARAERAEAEAAAQEAMLAQEQGKGMQEMGAGQEAMNQMAGAA